MRREIKRLDGRNSLSAGVVKGSDELLVQRVHQLTISPNGSGRKEIADAEFARRRLHL